MAATTARTFDAGKKYPLLVSDRLLQREHTPYSLSSLQVSPDLRLPRDIKSAKLVPNQSERDGVNLQLSTPSSMFVFEGKQIKSDLHSLTWNPDSQSLLLDRVDTELSFTKLPESRDSSRDGSPTKTDFVKDLIDEEGESDPENPYDWRHQLKVERAPSPDQNPTQSTLGVPSLSYSNSPSSLGRALNGTLNSYPIARTPMSRTSLSPAPTSAPVSREQPKPRRPRKEEPEPEADTEDDLSGVLEIIDDGAIHKRGRQRWRAWDESATPSGQTPRGLESTAISPSPLPGKTKGARPGSSLGFSARQATSSESDDGDVDSIRLGTPLHQEEGEKKEKVEDPPTPADVRDDDGMDDLEREMENELLAEMATEQASEESEESEEE